METCLVGIDWQKSFCNLVINPSVDPEKDDMSSQEVFLKNTDYQQRVHDGELYVPGSLENAENCVRLIQEGNPDAIVEAFDSHSSIHCSFPTYYDTKPPYFCFIRPKPDSQETFEGFFPDKPDEIVWEGTTRNPDWAAEHSHYLNSLLGIGRFPHCIWPPHCIVGTPGWGLIEPIANAFSEWEVRNGKEVKNIFKGTDRDREHFGIPRAEVPNEKNPATKTNLEYFNYLMKFQEIWITGQALYHCVWNTIWDTADIASAKGIMYDLENGIENAFLKKCTLFYDPTGNDGCTSPVAGVTVPNQDKLLGWAQQLGMRISTVGEYLAR